MRRLLAILATLAAVSSVLLSVGVAIEPAAAAEPDGVALPTPCLSG